MRVQQVESDAYVFVGEAYQSNSLILTSGDEALLVDALGSERDAEKLRDYVEQELEKQVRFIVCTHYFSDHLAALKLFPEGRIIAHANYRHTFDSELHRSEEERGHFVEPDILISDELRLKWGRYTLDVFHNPGHTMSTLGIDIPEADLIAAGDTVVGNIVYLAYSSPELLLPALERLRRRGRTRLLTSHLGLRRADAIDHALFYLRSLRDKVKAARDSADQESLIREINLWSCLVPGAEASEFEMIFHNRNLESIIERKLFATA
ncbi:MAG TPA: MBL fold metallo-hydrolase [Blastocatellia bacterium]|nr:MBL fold metallo-hydrolase [Blastocatellia bacterium]